MVNRVKAVLFRKSTSALLVLAATAIASGAMIVSASTTINQIGSDIDGEAAGDYSGFSVSLSSDGTAVAIGAHLNDGNGADSGHVRVYEWNGNAWIQKGADIDGEAEGDYSGFSVSLSSDGTVVAVGAQRNGAYSGHVRVYGWNENAWQQKGADIDGEAEGDRSGRSVSLSSDGTRVAVGADINSETGVDAGHVRVYSITTSTPTTTTIAPTTTTVAPTTTTVAPTTTTVGPTTTTTTTVAPTTTTTAPTTTTTTAAPTTTAPLTTEAPTTTTVMLPATGLSNEAAPQVLLVLGIGGLLVLFTRHRPSVRD